jgi:hypothetical protein
MRLIPILLSLVIAPLLFAQDTAPATRVLPLKSPVLLEFTAEVSSKTAHKGSPVEFLLAEDVLIDGQRLIHAQKSWFGGRGGELIIAARYIQHGEQRVSLRSLKPLAGPYAGKNNSDAALAVSMIPYAGLVSLFITGGEIVIPAGTKALALTAVEAQIAVSPATP